MPDNGDTAASVLYKEVQVHACSSSVSALAGLLLSLLAVGFCLPLQAKPRLSVAWSHWPPFSYINPQGTLDGLDVTLTRQILSQAGLESHFRNLPWARAIHLLEQQQLDVAMGRSIRRSGAPCPLLGALSAQYLRAAEQQPHPGPA